MNNIKFKDEFMFGAASASYQVEGAYLEDGKVLSNWDVFSHIPGVTFEGTNGDVAVDHYHRYKEDVRLMKEMGLESYRFSISWSRIISDLDGTINQKGLDFYNNLINELIQNDIVPFVTLYHWDLPQYLEEIGGWSNRDIIGYFSEFSSVCFENFADRVKHFITFNEMVVFTSLGYLEAAHPPKLTDEKKYIQACHNVHMSHATAVLNYKEKYDGEIGITHVLAPQYAADTTQSSYNAKKWTDLNAFDWFYEPTLKGTYPSELQFKFTDNNIIISNEDKEILLKAAPLNDFVGVNYYQPTRVKENTSNKTKELSRENATGGAGNISFDGKTVSVKSEHSKFTQWDWEIYPEALYDGIKQIVDTYGYIKVYVTENGLGDVDKLDGLEIKDQARIDYIKPHLEQINKLIQNGYNVGGYYAWSFTDLLSWLNGYKKQYGFVYVDHKNNLERRKKDSYYWYQEVIKHRHT